MSSYNYNGFTGFLQVLQHLATNRKTKWSKHNSMNQLISNLSHPNDYWHLLFQKSNARIIVANFDEDDAYDVFCEAYKAGFLSESPEVYHALSTLILLSYIGGLNVTVLRNFHSVLKLTMTHHWAST